MFIDERYKPIAVRLARRPLTGRRLAGHGPVEVGCAQSGLASSVDQVAHVPAAHDAVPRRVRVAGSFGVLVLFFQFSPVHTPCHKWNLRWVIFTLLPEGSSD
jgi:hypothetical protein